MAGFLPFVEAVRLGAADEDPGSAVFKDSSLWTGLRVLDAAAVSAVVSSEAASVEAAL